MPPSCAVSLAHASGWDFKRRVHSLALRACIHTVSTLFAHKNARQKMPGFCLLIHNSNGVKPCRYRNRLRYRRRSPLQLQHRRALLALPVLVAQRIRLRISDA